MTADECERWSESEIGLDVFGPTPGRALHDSLGSAVVATNTAERLG
ncbi:hypothetical protein [Amnibacterium endophyticum]|uniref:Uncharacterized protein n=1 Tax=Amnibacterium endophyticum TaxID=2109337 RepID=A0ABW4LAI7_9MICO